MAAGRAQMRAIIVNSTFENVALAVSSAGGLHQPTGKYFTSESCESIDVV